MLLSLGGRRRATRTGSSSTDRRSAFCHIEVQPAVASHNADERNQPFHPRQTRVCLGWRPPGPLAPIYCQI
jgi:hypothetical protein